jgi:hypothetical protein
VRRPENAIWLFADQEGRSQRVEVRKENFRWTSTVWVNGLQVGKFSWWRNKEIELPLENIEARLFVKQDFANRRSLYALTVENQVVKSGEKLDFTRKPSYPKPDLFPSEPFRQRMKRAASLFLGAMAFQLGIRWLFGDDDHPVSESILLSLVIALSRMCESRRAWILTLIGITLILIGSRAAYAEWLKQWLAGW